jgi:hypothetical protein
VCDRFVTAPFHNWDSNRECAVLRGDDCLLPPHLSPPHTPCSALSPQALLFGVHMLLAYLVMLLVMLYEAAIFIAVLLGLATAYFLFELLSAK